MSGRRRALMTHNKYSSGYVTDGLILQLDAINYIGDSTKWVDLVGGKEFTINGNNIIRSADSVIFGGNSYLSCPTVFDYKTLEIVYKTTSTNYQTLLITGGSADKTVCINRNTGFVIQFGGLASAIAFYGVGNKRTCVQAHFSNSYSNVLIDGINPSRATVERWNGITNGTQIGKYSTNAYYLIGELCAIRMYSRKLSAEELENNRNTDIARFNI